MESIIGLYKIGCIRPGPFHAGPRRPIADVEYATMAWVDWWNNRRLHSTLGILTPDEHEQAHDAAPREPHPDESGEEPRDGSV
jgi:transposase InsO family protein